MIERLTKPIQANLREVVLLILDTVPQSLVRTRFYTHLRRKLSRNPKRFIPATPRPQRPGEEWRQRKLVFPGTDLVVEGFPGSGNSFLANSLRDLLSPQTLVTSHFHYTVQLKCALAHAVAAVVIVREPLAASNSFKSKRPELWDWLILLRWIVYHRFLLRNGHRLDIFLFEEVIADPDLVRRHSPSVARLLDRPLVGNLDYRRSTECRREVRKDLFLSRILLARARTLHRSIRTLASRI